MTAVLPLLLAIGAPAPARPVLPPVTHQVRMLGTGDHPRFDPAEVRIAPGDSIVFVVVSGAPHNVAFDTTALDAPARDRLRAAVHEAIQPMAGPLLLQTGERYAISFVGMPPGRYPFYCMPHAAMHMQGVVVVQ